MKNNLRNILLASSLTLGVGIVGGYALSNLTGEVGDYAINYIEGLLKTPEKQYHLGSFGIVEFNMDVFPKKYQDYQLEDFSIPTKGHVSKISLVQEELYNISFEEDGSVKLEGKLAYCIHSRDVPFGERSSSQYGCDIRKGEITLKKNDGLL